MPGVLMMISERAFFVTFGRVACSMLLLLVVSWPSSSPASGSAKRAKQLDREQVASVWVGLSRSGHDMLHLRLELEGGGAAAYAFWDDAPRLFSVRRWTYLGDQIEIFLESADDSTFEVPTVRGTVTGRSMRLTMSGKGWEQHLDLRLEGMLEKRWLRLKKTIADAAP